MIDGLGKATYFGYPAFVTVTFAGYLLAVHSSQALDASRRLDAAKLTMDFDVPSFEQPPLQIEDLAAVIEKQMEVLADLSKDVPNQQLLIAAQNSASRVATKAHAISEAANVQLELLEDHTQAFAGAADAAVIAVAMNSRLLSTTNTTGELAEIDAENVKMEQLGLASDISVFFSAIFFAFMAFYIILSGKDEDLGVIQRSALNKRLEACLTICLYICFFSCLFNVVQLGDGDNIKFTAADVNHTLDLGRPVEWILTCPLMQLIVAVMGGEKVPDSRRTIMPLLAFIILVFGLCSAMAEAPWMRVFFYCCGGLNFCILLYTMNECVRNASNNTESLCSGKSRYQKLCLMVASTWAPFPAWYALSPEGFNIVTNSPAMKVAVAFLNVFSKGVFVLFLMRVRADERIASGIFESDAKAQTAVVPSSSKDYVDPIEKYHQPTGRLLGLVQETLESIGRQADYDGVVRILSANMITTPDDVMLLNEQYCSKIHLPWTFVYSFKETARRKKVRDSDQWDLAPDAKFGLYANASPSAPHIARNQEKLNYALRHPTYATSSRFAEQLPETYQILKGERHMSPGPNFDKQSTSRAPSETGSVARLDEDMPATPRLGEARTEPQSPFAPRHLSEEEAIARVQAEIELLQKSSNDQNLESKMEEYVQAAIYSKVNESLQKAKAQQSRDAR
jgi:bacteriorhodopsin